MIPNLLSLSSKKLGGFFQEAGGQTTEIPYPLPDGKMLVSFDSQDLDEPVQAMFNVGDSAFQAAATLLIVERGLIDVRMKTPLTESSPCWFLEKSTERGSAQTKSNHELLELGAPSSPAAELRSYLASLDLECRQHGFPFARDFHSSVGNTAATLIHYTVARYYPQVDRGMESDLKEVCDLFAADGVYNRAGKPLRGKSSIESFYFGGRTLKGQHSIDSIAVSGLTAFVTGVFEGISIKENASRRLEFTDRWRFNTDGFVTFRDTYLSEGYSNAE